jgi:hypothetical protein
MTAFTAYAPVSTHLQSNEDEHEYDLYWHALNYRTAGTKEAQAMWVELEECVQRLIQRGEDMRDW